MKAIKVKLDDITLGMVKVSQFGCRNCLYQSCECSPIGVNFIPKLSPHKSLPSCQNYAYYD